MKRGVQERVLKARWIALAWCVIAPLLALDEVTAASLLIHDVSVIDPIDGQQAAIDVLIEDGLIADMGTDLHIDPTAERVDGSGKYLLPGLWDMHVHLTYDPRLPAEKMAQLFLDYGITSVRDTGGNLQAVSAAAAKLDSMQSMAPRVFFAGPLLDGQAVVYAGQNGGAALGEAIETSLAAEDRVATLREHGASFIKIYEMVEPEVFRALVKAARAQGMPIAAHVPLSMLASDVAPQVDSLEHLRNLELDCAANAVVLLESRREQLRIKREVDGAELRSGIHALQRNLAIEDEDLDRCSRVLRSLQDTVQVPTLRLNAMTQHPPFHSAGWEDALQRSPEAIRSDWANAPEYMDWQKYRRLGEWSLAMIARLADAGVPIGAGTDTPIGWAVPGFSLHRELELLVLAGLTPIEALRAATLVPASFFGLEERNGRVAVGYEADLIIVDRNPLDDIRNTQRIHSVISRGEVVRHPGRGDESP